MPHLSGPVNGPPLYAGDRHSVMIASITAYIAALSGLLARPGKRARQLSVNILEANLAVSEMQIHYIELDGGRLLKRHGINRFSPNAPLGIYACKDGWVRITASTPDQWKSLCVALELNEEGKNERFATREQRFLLVDEVAPGVRWPPRTK